MNNTFWDITELKRYDLWLNTNFKKNDPLKEKIKLFLLLKFHDKNIINKKEIIIGYKKWQKNINKKFWPKCNKKWNLEENALKLLNYQEHMDQSKNPIMCRYQIQQYCRQQFIFNCQYINDIDLLNYFISHPFFGYSYEFEANVHDGLISSTSTSSSTRIHLTIIEALENLIERNHFKSFKILFKKFYNPKKIKKEFYLNKIESYILFINNSLYFNHYQKEHKNKFLLFLEKQKNDYPI